MYVVLLDGGRRLVTSDAERLCLYELRDGAPSLLTEVRQPGQIPYFEQSPAGERLTHGAGVVVRSFTPLDATEHWTEVPSRVGLHAAADLSTVAILEVGERLDHESLAISPDGQHIASTSRGGGAVVFDARSGARLWAVDGEIASGTSWSPNGRWLALGETGQGEGELTLIDTRPEGGGEPKKHVLPAPSGEFGLDDSPFRSMFSPDGRFVVFTSASWGTGGVVVYDVATREEVWSASFPVAGSEDVETWPAPELDLALDGALVLVGQDGQVMAHGSIDGRERSPLEHHGADGHYFAADSARRGVWVTRGGQPVLLPFPDDWR